MKKIISLITVLGFVITALCVGTISSSAVTNKNAPMYASRTAYMQEVRQGKSFYTKSFSKSLSTTFAFTLTDDAYCMINWGFKDEGTSNSVKVYYDADLMNEVKVDKIWSVPSNQNNALYTQDILAKGTYYVKVKIHVKETTPLNFM